MKRTILLVEDSPDDQALALRALKKSRVANRVIVASDGQEALDYLFRTGKHAGRDPLESAQVVLLDLKLPGMDGLDVLRAIRKDERTRYLPVVVLTTSREQVDLLASYDLGANSFVRKPIDFEQFAEAVRLLGLYWLVVNESPAPSQT